MTAAPIGWRRTRHWKRRTLAFWTRLGPPKGRHRPQSEPPNPQTAPQRPRPNPAPQPRAPTPAPQAPDPRPLRSDGLARLQVAPSTLARRADGRDGTNGAR